MGVGEVVCGIEGVEGDVVFVVWVVGWDGFCGEVEVWVVMWGGGVCVQRLVGGCQRGSGGEEGEGADVGGSLMGGIGDVGAGIVVVVLGIVVRGHCGAVLEWSLRSVAT